MCWIFLDPGALPLAASVLLGLLQDAMSPCSTLSRGTEHLSRGTEHGRCGSHRGVKAVWKGIHAGGTAS